MEAETKDGMRNFISKLLSASPITIDRLEPHEREDANQALINMLLGNESIAPNRTPQPDEIWWNNRLFKPTSAIINCYEGLLDVNIYIRRFPYRNTRIMPSTYLKHNTQVYAQEVYILRERLIGLLNILEKDYAGSHAGNEIKRINGPMARTIKDLISPIIEARKEHVHKLGVADEAISRLEALELYSKYGNKIEETEEGSEFVKYLKMESAKAFKEQRKKLDKNIRNWNASIQTILDGYFKVIDQIIFTESGDLTYPEAIKS